MLIGDYGDDTLFGLGANGPSGGGSSNDKVDGGPDHDRIDGSDGDDTLLGGDGDDFILEQGFGNEISSTRAPARPPDQGPAGHGRALRAFRLTAPVSSRPSQATATSS